MVLLITLSYNYSHICVKYFFSVCYSSQENGEFKDRSDFQPKI